MAALTLNDLGRRMDKDDSIAKIIEIMNETDAMDDVMMVECNMGTMHKTTERTGLPSPTFRALNRGVTPSKSTTMQVTDSCAMLEDYLEADKALAELYGNRNEFLLSETKPKIEAFRQKLMETVFYGKRSDIKEFVGLTERYNSKNAKTFENMINAGGATVDGQTSVWLVGWGENTIHGLYPKGSKAGMQLGPTQDVTIQVAAADGGGQFEGIRKHFRWDMGLTVRDWRYAVRIANVDIAAIRTGTSAPDLITAMIKAAERVPDTGATRWAFYCNRDVRTALRLQILAKSNVNLTFDTVNGRRVLAFGDIPVRRVDRLKVDEAVVAFA